MHVVSIIMSNRHIPVKLDYIFYFVLIRPEYFAKMT